MSLDAMAATRFLPRTGTRGSSRTARWRRRVLRTTRKQCALDGACALRLRPLLSDAWRFALNIKNIVGWLAGSVLVYGVVVACSSDSGSDGSAHAQTGGASANGGSGNATGCGACSVPERMKVITADTDLDQHVGTVTSVPQGASATSLATGPFYLTDARWGGGPADYLVAPAGGSCDQGVTLAVADPSSDLRILIGADQQLCALNRSEFTTVNFFWSGFRPY